MNSNDGSRIYIVISDSDSSDSSDRNRESERGTVTDNYHPIVVRYRYISKTNKYEGEVIVNSTDTVTILRETIVQNMARFGDSSANAEYTFIRSEPIEVVMPSNKTVAEAGLEGQTIIVI